MLKSSTSKRKKLSKKACQITLAGLFHGRIRRLEYVLQTRSKIAAIP